MLKLGLGLAFVSLITMVVIDRILGSRAEFLNAWSVLERLLGRSPSAGISVVAARIGSAGEFAVVIVANVVIGFLLALVIRLVMRLS